MAAILHTFAHRKASAVIVIPGSSIHTPQNNSVHALNSAPLLHVPLALQKPQKYKFRPEGCAHTQLEDPPLRSNHSTKDSLWFSTIQVLLVKVYNILQDHGS